MNQLTREENTSAGTAWDYVYDSAGNIQRMNGVSHEDIDWTAVVIDGASGAVGAALTFGVADVGGPGAKTVRELFKQSGRKILKQAGEDFLMSTVISAGTLLNAEKIKYISRNASYDK